MIVDDMPAATRAMGKLLEKRGYDTIEDTDSTKALALAHKFKPDLILLDVSMPWKNGYEVANDLSQDNQLRDIPVIMMTAYEQEIDPVHTQPVLIKPFTIEELLENVAKCLRGQPVTSV